MKELFVEKSLDFYLHFLNVNKRKFWTQRIVLSVFIFVMLLFFFLASKITLFLILSPVLTYLVYKIPYFKIIGAKNHVDIVNSFLFPHFLRTFLSLLATQGNVFQTLVATIPYLDDPLKSEVEKLIKKIGEKNDRKYYLEFAEYVGSNEAYLIMSMIYEFSIVGTNSDLLSALENYINSIQTNKMTELKRYKLNKMEKHANIPVYISVGFVLVFTFSLMYFYISNMSNLL